MILEIYQNKKLVNTIKSQQQIVSVLLSHLWRKAINKRGSHIYHYNYSDKQTLTIKYDNNYDYVIKNIPTEWGSIKDYDIINMLKTEIINEQKESE